MPQKLTRKRVVQIGLAVTALYLFSGCAMLAPPRMYTDFMVVTAKPWDSARSLARKHLKDTSKGPLITEFNGIDSVRTGQEIVIPLKPVRPGGLYVNGYQTVPVLAYHRFAESASSKTIVEKASFDQQMRYLKENGYSVITLENLLDFIDFASDIPPKAVVITIDDGWRSVYDIAFPILKKYGFTATLFLYSDFIGSPKALTWEQVRKMADYGFEIQCQTKTHRSLSRMKKNESFENYFAAVQQELRAPRRVIKQKTGRTCDCLAYPFGDTSPLVRAMLEQEGYRAGFTVKRGSNPFFVDKYLINRSSIYGEYSLKKFKSNLKAFHRKQLQ